MTKRAPTRGTTRKAIPAGEQGYVLLLAIFLMALLVLTLAIAAPKIARSIQRDRDLETWHRGMQYRRAVQLYYRKFKAYPPNVQALVETNNIKFLRKKYKDPLTGQDDWKPVMFGQNKTPTAMGFFGQPLSGNASTLAGIGPSGGSAASTTSSGSSFGNSSFGSSSSGSSSFGSSSFSSSSSTFGSSDTGSGQSSSGTDSSSSGSASGTDSSGSASSSGGTTSAGSSSSGSSSSGSSSFGSGQTFGGAGIIGFSPASPKQSILIVKKKNHYNEWEFTYDPLSEMKTISGNTGMIGQSAASTSSAVGSSTFGSSSFGSSSSSSSSGSSSSGSQSTSP
ncbi:MAG: type II secretion system protein [Terracidiphilus sp.]